MRLHACLMAMLGGTAAMGLAYESKTPEAYRRLGLKAYQVPFTAYQTAWCACASRLLDNLDVVRADLPAILERISARAWRSLAHLDRLVEQRN
jgi:polysaccharide pyruvyl transferase WcaK-like protein